MKKIAVTLLVVFLSLTACSKKSSSSNQSSSAASAEVSVLQRPNVDLFIGTDEWPPYEGKIDGKPAGFVVKLVSEVLKRMGKTYEIQVFPWKKGISMVFDGKLDALFSASQKAERAKCCFYPEEANLSSQYVFFIRKSDVGKLQYRSYSDLLGHRVGVSSGYSYNEDFWNFVKTNQIYDEASDDKINLKKLSRNRIDYFPCELGNGLELLKELGLSDQITYLPKPVIEKPYYIIFSKKTVSKDLVKQYSEALKVFKKTKEYQELYRHYFE